MRPSRVKRWILATLLGTALARADTPASQLLLANRYGELCTMCEGYLRCSLGTDAFTLYHVQTKDFWQQIATIGDWFMSSFRAQRDEQRHLEVYQRYTDAQGRKISVILPEMEARLSMSSARIDVPGGWIDRRSAVWHQDKANVPGRCESVSVAEGSRMSESFGRKGKS